ncbi:prolipoprotein diacylglyceryl transferase [Radicibacter daui]|uniref:prolipoprotein diacylglyceryl transferase n=1 Tax=Radicibacter daui TaxID=3064829 RepID=UPI004046A93E
MPGLPYPDIDPIAFHLGPLAVRWYGLAYLAGFVLGWRYAISLAKRGANFIGAPKVSDIDDYLTWIVVGVILGGRIGYVLFYNLSFYVVNPLDIFMVWHGGMSFHGGFLGVAMVTFLFSRRRGIAPLALADLACAAAPIGLFFGRIANFINGELWGRPWDGPWSMVFPGDKDHLPRHPSQLYEAALEGIVLFSVLALLARVPAVRRRPGVLSGIFVIGYGLARVVVEHFRQPDAQLNYLAFGLTMGQILSLPMIAAGVALAVWCWRRGLAPLSPAEPVPATPEPAR